MTFRHIYFVVATAIIVLFTRPLFAQPAPRLDWQHCYGGSELENSRLFVRPHDHMMVHTSDGGYVFLAQTNSYDAPVTGNHHDTTTNPTFDFWLVKLDASGNIQWEKCFGGTSDESPTCILQASDGGYVLCGKTRSHDGDVTDNHPGSKLGQYDAWIVKTDASGQIEWTRCSGSGSGDEVFNSVIEISDGYLAVGVTSAITEEAHKVDGGLSEGDALIVKFDKHGVEQWRRVYGDFGGDGANAVVPFPSGGYVYAGFLSKVVPAGGPGPYLHAWIVRLDTAGYLVWQRDYGGQIFVFCDAQEIANTILPIANGFMVGGSTTSPDGDVVGKHGGRGVRDGWVFTIDTMGRLLRQHCFGGSGDEIITSIIPTLDGNYIFAGSTGSNDGDISGLHFPAYDTLPYNTDSTDAWVGKFSPGYQLLWQKCMGGYFRDYFYTALENSDQSLMLYGSTESVTIGEQSNGDITHMSGYADAWLVKLRSPLSSVERTTSRSQIAFPNPAPRNVSIALDAKAVQSVHFYDQVGAEVFPEYDMMGTTLVANVQQLPPGMFVVNVSYEDHQQIAKFVHTEF